MVDVNENLRNHVTTSAFVLTLRQSHIAVLVYLDLLHRGLCEPIRRSSIRGINDFVGPVRGLEARGLVEHYFPPQGFGGTRDEFNMLTHDERTERFPLQSYYPITPAGDAVLVLLRERGIYAEVSPSIVASRQIEVPA